MQDNQSKWRYYIIRVSKEENEEKILDHINKHCHEFNNKKDKNIDNWMDSMINLIAIYREIKNKHYFFNFDNMIKRMELYRKRRNLKPIL